MSTPNSRGSGSPTGPPKPPEGDADNQQDQGNSPDDTNGHTQDTAPDAANGDTTDNSLGGSDTAKPESFADVMAGLDETAQRLVRAKLNEKNNENRSLRRRLNGGNQAATDTGHNEDDTAEPGASERERSAIAREQAANRRMVHAEIRALAVDRLADPSDAPPFLGAVDDYLGADGDPDSDAIRLALDELLDRKPHLAKPTPQSATSPRPPAPNPAQGATAPVRNNGQGGVAEAERRFGKRAGTAATH